MRDEYIKARRKLAKAIETCLCNGLDEKEIGMMISESEEIPAELAQECFLIAKVGDVYKCFPIKGVQAQTLSQININRMHSGEGTRIEIEELDLTQICAKPVNSQKM